MNPTKTLLLPGFLNPPSLPGDFFWLHENNTIDAGTVWHYTKNMDTQEHKMKVKTAVKRVELAVNYGEFKMANHLLNKYRRRFGNRHFTYWLRLTIANGVYFTVE